MVNEKGRENIPLWDTFTSSSSSPVRGSDSTTTIDKFHLFFVRTLLLFSDTTLSYRESSALLTFLIHIYQSLEYDLIRKVALRLISLPLWKSVAVTRVELELLKYPTALRKPWTKLNIEYEQLKSNAGQYDALLHTLFSNKSNTDTSTIVNNAISTNSTSTPTITSSTISATSSTPIGTKRSRSTTDQEQDIDDEVSTKNNTETFEKVFADPLIFNHLCKRLDYSFIPSLLVRFYTILEKGSSSTSNNTTNHATVDNLDRSSIHYCERFLELVIDLLSQLPTRRFFHLLLDDSHFLLRCQQSSLAKRTPYIPSAYNISTASTNISSVPNKGNNSGNKISSSHDASIIASLVASSSGFIGGAANTDTDMDTEETPSVSITSTNTVSTTLSTEPSKSVPSTGTNDGKLFIQLLDMVSFFINFEIDDQTGTALTDRDTEGLHYQQVAALQALVYKLYGTDENHKEIKEFALCATGLAAQPSTIRGYINSLTDEQVYRLLFNLRLLPVPKDYIEISSYFNQHSMSPITLLPSIPQPSLNRKYAMNVLLDKYRKRPSQLRAINSLSLYPSELLLWDPNLVPAGNKFSNHKGLALPKLNLQFLTLYDYLLRCFVLFRLESAYEIRADIVDAVKRISPRQTTINERITGTVIRTVFTGWSRNAVPVDNFVIKQVLAPRVGQDIPSAVLAEVRYDTNRFNQSIRTEWDNLREHDVCFLITIRSPIPISTHPDDTEADPTQNAGKKTGGKKIEKIADEEDFTFPVRYGIMAVRGCEVYEILDEKNEVFNDPSTMRTGEDRQRKPFGSKRSLRVKLDNAQYYQDTVTKQGHIYESFNLLVRRDAKANNFKAVLETIRDVMNSTAAGGSVPAWLQDIFLGYGDPSSAFYANLPSGVQIDNMDFRDTFLSAEHVRASFPKAKVTFIHEETGESIPDQQALPPYRLRFEPLETDNDSSASLTSMNEQITVIPYAPPPTGPYPEDIPQRNTIPFTSVQVKAIRSGTNPGLTLIVGPPGTGKTDTAVQIITNLYHNFPSQKLLLVTHSNQALNDLFEKLLQRDVAEHHLLRLGSGERDLETEGDFSKAGRVTLALERRIHCLKEVDRLGQSIGIVGDVGYTCETAEYFNLQHVKTRIDQFRHQFKLPIPPLPTGLEPTPSVILNQTNKQRSMYKTNNISRASSIYAAASEEGAAARIAYRQKLANQVKDLSPSVLKQTFPFRQYFANAPGGVDRIFPDHGTAIEYVNQIEACFRHLSDIFDELQSYRAFELLRSHRSRTDYMLVKQARIVAMTCTHAAIMRSHFLALDFKYDTLVMEEAGQVLEVETLIPMLLQPPETIAPSADSVGNSNDTNGSKSRLKRVILIGDHNQLPPVVQNMAFAKYGHLDQSMFTRFIRSGVPYIELNAQGRARSSISALYTWRYKQLGNLPNVMDPKSVYHIANPGFLNDYQFINVPDYMGRGEYTPMAHFYQNLGEAEYIVAVYQYMRLVGYPASSIAILTTYNGQKALIRDIIRQRCLPYSIFGEPSKIETVDKYQGQQNDYILLSLVRTRTVGHLRDVRRLIVALSRARLGLYIFGRFSIFNNCLELIPAFSQLQQRSTDLQLLIGESYPTVRTINDNIDTVVEKHKGLLTKLTVKHVQEMGTVLQRILQAQQTFSSSSHTESSTTQGMIVSSSTILNSNTDTTMEGSNTRQGKDDDEKETIRPEATETYGEEEEEEEEDE